MIPSSNPCSTDNKYKTFVQCSRVFLVLFFFFRYQQAALETKNNSKIFKKLHLLWACSIKNHLQFLAGKLGISNQFLEIS